MDFFAGFRAIGPAGGPQPAGPVPIPRLDALGERGAAATSRRHGPRPSAVDGHRHRHGQRVRPQQLRFRRRSAVHRRQTPQTQTVQTDIRPCEKCIEKPQDRGEKDSQEERESATGTRGAASAKTQGSGTRKTSHCQEEGEEGDPDSRTHNGIVHRLLVAVLLHVHTEAGLPHSGHRFQHRLLARVTHPVGGRRSNRCANRFCCLFQIHEFGAEPGDLHDLQQGLPTRVPPDTVQVMFGVRVLLRVRLA